MIDTVTCLEIRAIHRHILADLQSTPPIGFGGWSIEQETLKFRGNRTPAIVFKNDVVPLYVSAFPTLGEVRWSACLAAAALVGGDRELLERLNIQLAYEINKLDYARASKPPIGKQH